MMFAAYGNQLNQTSADSSTPHFAEHRGVRFYSSPWVSGQVASSYFGPIGHELLFEPGTVTWSEGIDCVIETMADMAVNCGANAVVGCEMILDPYPAIRLRLVGTTPVADTQPTLWLAMNGTGAELRRL